MAPFFSVTYGLVCVRLLFAPRDPPESRLGRGRVEGVQVKGCFVLIWCYSERRSADKGCLTPSEADTHGQPGREDAGSERSGEEGGSERE